MARQRYGLGRGLDALMTSDVAVQSPSALDESAVVHIAIDDILPNPRQPRRIVQENDAAVLSLSRSIQDVGLLQPLLVTRLEKTSSATQTKGKTSWKYQIIAGERRWRAARIAGLSTVPVVLKEVTSQQMLELALIENIQRADLNPIEEALAYQSLVEEFSLKQAQIAEKVGKERSTIANILRLLQLCPEVRDVLINQTANFTEGHARCLIGLSSLDQIALMKRTIDHMLTVRQTEELAARVKMRDGSTDFRIAARAVKDPQLLTIELRLRSTFSSKVDVVCNATGRGKIVLHFNDPKELDSLYSRLVKKSQ